MVAGEFQKPTARWTSLMALSVSLPDRCAKDKPSLASVRYGMCDCRKRHVRSHLTTSQYVPANTQSYQADL